MSIQRTLSIQSFSRNTKNIELILLYQCAEELVGDFQKISDVTTSITATMPVRRKTEIN
jgi:hypothetical protein